MARNIELGQRGERIAAELDLVTIDRGTVVAVEVKTRSSLEFGHPFEAISPLKLHRLYRLAWEWCTAHRMNGARVRVDAVAVIVWRDGALPSIEYLEGVR